MIDDIYSL